MRVKIFILKEINTLPNFIQKPCGFTVKISSRGHRHLIYIVNRNTKTDGMGPFKCNPMRKKVRVSAYTIIGLYRFL